MKKIFISSILLIVLGCNDSNLSDNELVQETDICDFPSFCDFPAFPFEDLAFGLDNETVMLRLKSSDFALSEQENFYYRKQDSIGIFLPNSDELNNFKIIIENKHYLSKKDDFLSFLEENASKSNKNENFWVGNFMLEQPFKMSVFSQKDYLRLEYNLN